MNEICNVLKPLDRLVAFAILYYLYGHVNNKKLCCYCWLQADFFDKRFCCRFSFGHGELVTGDGVVEVSGDLSLHLRLPFVSEPRARISRNSSLESQAFLKRAFTGNRLLSSTRENGNLCNLL